MKASECLKIGIGGDSDKQESRARLGKNRRIAVDGEKKKKMNKLENEEAGAEGLGPHRTPPELAQLVFTGQ